MDRSDVRELHYIAAHENIRSIMNLGILSFARAAPFGHTSWALETAQERRAKKYPTAGRSVHEFANVYFDAHNPTLSRLRTRNATLTVLRVSPGILDIPGTMIATRNAASGGVEFHPSPAGLAHLDAPRLYAEFWLDPDEEVKREWGHIKCAEVLVPDVIDARHIEGAYVVSDACAGRVRSLCGGLDVVVWPQLFFGT